MEEELSRVWRALEDWDQERPKSFPLACARAQLYKGAMEIPLVAFHPRVPVNPAEDRVAALAPTLARFGLELDCVEIGQNYKVNRSDTKEYVGRIQPDALKLHAERVLGLGREVFDEIVTFYLRLPTA
ncbi:MAG: hypothetical protein HYW08_11850 [candidate division NC10 bacterium]|nr:hypothetical protein [Candidatus Rokubacteria bacterium]MBI2563056.1 hypothetical protein [candidate division NC10 bacterium]